MVLRQQNFWSRGLEVQVKKFSSQDLSTPTLRWSKVGPRSEPKNFRVMTEVDHLGRSKSRW